jgi:death-on-curing protein
VILYLSVAQVLDLHESQISRHGGKAGLRDRASLESAVNRPMASFGGDDLYPDLASKVAALMHSLVMNHPFVDGNKRVGAHAAIVMALANGSDLRVEPEDLLAVTMSTARGELPAEALAIWFRQRLVTL